MKKVLFLLIFVTVLWVAGYEYGKRKKNKYHKVNF